MSRAHGVISQEYHSQGGVETMNNTFTLAIEMDWREGDQIGFCSDPNELSNSLWAVTLAVKIMRERN